MEAILKYALVLFPFLLILWMGFSELRKRYLVQTYGHLRLSGEMSFPEAVEVLEAGGHDYPRAFRAAQLLGDLPPSELSKRAIHALAGCLTDSEPKLRLLAAISLGRIGDASAIPALGAATTSSVTADERARYEAASVDRKFHEARARREGYSGSEIRVSDPAELHAEVRQAATHAIREIGKRHGR